MSLQFRKLVPTVDFWQWRRMGACQDAPSELFFHGEDTPRGERRRNERAAKHICKSCQVLDICRGHALDVGERYGVWGGLTENERIRILADEVSSGDNTNSPRSIR